LYFLRLILNVFALVLANRAKIDSAAAAPFLVYGFKVLWYFFYI